MIQHADPPSMIAAWALVLAEIEEAEAAEQELEPEAADE